MPLWFGFISSPQTSGQTASSQKPNSIFSSMWQESGEPCHNEGSSHSVLLTLLRSLSDLVQQISGSPFDLAFPGSPPNHRLPVTGMKGKIKRGQTRKLSYVWIKMSICENICFTERWLNIKQTLQGGNETVRSLPESNKCQHEHTQKYFTLGPGGPGIPGGPYKYK